MNTLPDLDSLEAIARAATPGAWSAPVDHRMVFSAAGNVVLSAASTGICGRDPGDYYACHCPTSETWLTLSESDRQFIATFDPPTVLALITELSALRTAKAGDGWKPEACAHLNVRVNTALSGSIVQNCIDCGRNVQILPSVSPEEGE